jgi:hypothetical protein
MRTVLAGDPTQDKQLAAALTAVGYTESLPVLCPGHPIWDAADSDITGIAPGVAFVPADTTSPKSVMGDLSIPELKEFHEALCELYLKA